MAVLLQSKVSPVLTLKLSEFYWRITNVVDQCLHSIQARGLGRENSS